MKSRFSYLYNILFFLFEIIFTSILVINYTVETLE